MNDAATVFHPLDETNDQPITPEWGDDAPRGGRAVLTRIIKEGANVPLFLSQTLVNALRDLGYNHTTSAICEHVDNAVQWGATEVRIYFHETGKRGSEKRIDALVYDNGKGMAPTVLRAASAFGGSMCFANRTGIGRYGMGMKAAALSLSTVLDIYSWQERRAFYNMTLDVNEISAEKSNVVTLPEPELSDALPTDVRDILLSPMSFPKRAEESQSLLAADLEELEARLGKSGTIIYMPNCDRLTYRSARSLVEHATREMARVYRRYLERGIKLYVNNRLVEPFDPTYFMPNARHAGVPGLTEYRSRLVNTWTVPVPVEEEHPEVNEMITVRLFMLPIESWHDLPKKVLKNDLHVFDTGVSFMRSDREVEMAPLSVLGRTSRDAWWRLEVEFPPSLDEPFGVNVNKQGVRPKKYIEDFIKKLVHDDITTVRNRIERFQSERAAEQKKGKLSAAEQRANEAEALQATLLPQPTPRTDEERAELESRLRELAVGCKRTDETDDEAFERVKNSRYVIRFLHDEGPFYAVDFQLGRVLLSINTAHPFFEHIYKPIAELAKISETGADAEGNVDLDPELCASAQQLVTKLQLLLISLARTQSEMSANDSGGENKRIFTAVRKRWSDTLETMLISS